MFSAVVAYTQSIGKDKAVACILSRKRINPKSQVLLILLLCSPARAKRRYNRKTTDQKCRRKSEKKYFFPQIYQPDTIFLWQLCASRHYCFPLNKAEYSISNTGWMPFPVRQKRAYFDNCRFTPSSLSLSLFSPSSSYSPSSSHSISFPRFHGPPPILHRIVGV